MLKYFEEKKRLLHELKAETLNQLAAVQAKDPERFLHCTEMCNPIIEEVDALNLQGVLLTDEYSLELGELLQEIAQIREQISILIPPLYEKLKQKAQTEKQANFVKGRYSREVYPLPSIFLDKKI